MKGDVTPEETQCVALSLPLTGTMFCGAPKCMDTPIEFTRTRTFRASMELNEHGVFPTVFCELRRQYPKAVIGCLAE